MPASKYSTQTNKYKRVCIEVIASKQHEEASLNSTVSCREAVGKRSIWLLRNCVACEWKSGCRCLLSPNVPMECI